MNITKEIKKCRDCAGVCRKARKLVKELRLSKKAETMIGKTLDSVEETLRARKDCPLPSAKMAIIGLLVYYTE